MMVLEENFHFRMLWFLPLGPFDLVFVSDERTQGKVRSERLKAQQFLEKFRQNHATIDVQLKISQAKHKEKLDNHSIGLPSILGLRDLVVLKMSKDCVIYRPFHILELIGDNSFKLNFLPYLGTHLVTNCLSWCYLMMMGMARLSCHMLKICGLIEKIHKRKIAY